MNYWLGWRSRSKASPVRGKIRLFENILVNNPDMRAK